jgi:hypothetical protein
VFSDYYRALRDGVLWSEWLAIPRFRLVQFWGTYRGYAQHEPVSQQLRRTFYYPNQRCPEPTPTETGTSRRIHYDALEESNREPH